jgi:hypothetical protein
MKVDAEIRALREMTRFMETATEEEKSRVMYYLTARYFPEGDFSPVRLRLFGSDLISPDMILKKK